MNTRRTFRPVDWVLATIIGLFLVGAVIAQAHGAPNTTARAVHDRASAAGSLARPS